MIYFSKACENAILSKDTTYEQKCVSPEIAEVTAYLDAFIVKKTTGILRKLEQMIFRTGMILPKLI